MLAAKMAAELLLLVSLAGMPDSTLKATLKMI